LEERKRETMTQPTNFLEIARQRARQRLKNAMLASGSLIIGDDVILDVPKTPEEAEQMIRELVRRDGEELVREEAAVEGVSVEEYLMGDTLAHWVEDITEESDIEDKRKMLRDFAAERGHTFEEVLAILYMQTPEIEKQIYEDRRLW
jgi:hypothetical protein